MIIAPSILAADFMNLQSEVSFLSDDKIHDKLWLHLDVMDGHFVPNMTFGPPIITQLKKVTNIPLDVHLMVTNPLFYIEALATTGVHNLTFHLEASTDCHSLVQTAKKYFSSVGISIKPNTPVSAISLSLLKAIDLVLVMSVEPGFGGQKFMHNAADKISELVKLRHEHGLSFQIQVDGGIDETTAPIVNKAGADNLVAGSYIFKNKQSDYILKINKLLNS